jgi:hypothetical protein
MNQLTSRRRFGDLSTLRVTQLSTEEQFVVGVWRCCDAFAMSADPTRARRLLGPAFAYMGMLRAFCAFDRAFFELRAHSVRPLEFREVDDPLLGADEARLLGSVASLQRLNVGAAKNVLCSLFTRMSLRAALPPLARIAGHLEAQGHRLPIWE